LSIKKCISQTGKKMHLADSNFMEAKTKKIGHRIRELRKGESLSQNEFAHQLGVRRGYISTLETHRNEPSEQLLLNICRTFGVTYDWLKYGSEKKHGPRQLTSRGDLIIEEIIKEIESPEKKLPFRYLAQILDIDPEMPLKRLNLPKSFYYALMYLVNIFREGDPDKIEAILAQLKAFVPKLTVDKFKEDLKRKINKEG